MLTDDENIIDIQFAVQYTLKDPSLAYLFNNKRPGRGRACRRPKRRFAKWSARTRWTSCCTKGASKSPTRPPN